LPVAVTTHAVGPPTRRSTPAMTASRSKIPAMPESGLFSPNAMVWPFTGVPLGFGVAEDGFFVVLADLGLPVLLGRVLDFGLLVVPAGGW
jgi:hypothetical protein